MVKADLEDKVGALTDEINFLRAIYEEVRQAISSGMSLMCTKLHCFVESLTLSLMFIKTQHLICVRLNRHPYSVRLKIVFDVSEMVR